MLFEALQGLSGQTAARVEHVEALTGTALSCRETTKRLTAQGSFSVVQGRQRDVAGQLETAEAQVRFLDQTVRQLEQRRDQLAFAEKRIAGFEARIDGLAALADTLDRREADLVGRDGRCRRWRR